MSETFSERDFELLPLYILEENVPDAFQPYNVLNMAISEAWVSLAAIKPPLQSLTHQSGCL